MGISIGIGIGVGFGARKGAAKVYTKPIAHWSAKGKTNTDEDRGTLVDLTGNGRDITLNNFAYNTASGYDGDGGLVFDGVDDYGVNENMPLMSDYTVIIKRKHVKGHSGCIISKMIDNNGKTGAFNMELIDGTYSFGNKTFTSISENEIVYQTKRNYNGIELYVGTNVDVSYLYLGAIRTSDSRKFKGTFYEFYLFDKTLSEDEINYYKSKMQ